MLAKTAANLYGSLRGPFRTKNGPQIIAAHLRRNGVTAPRSAINMIARAWVVDADTIEQIGYNMQNIQRSGPKMAEAFYDERVFPVFFGKDGLGFDNVNNLLMQIDSAQKGLRRGFKPSWIDEPSQLLVAMTSAYKRSRVDLLSQSARLVGMILLLQLYPSDIVSRFDSLEFSQPRILSQGSDESLFLLAQAWHGFGSRPGLLGIATMLENIHLYPRQQAISYVRARPPFTKRQSKIRGASL